MTINSVDCAMNSIKALLFAVVTASSVPAVAAPCPSLPYEELQDMTVEELTQEACTARKRASENRAEAFDKLMSRHSPDKAGSEAASTEADKCDNETKRIFRALGKKGVDADKLDYATVCKAKKG